MVNERKPIKISADDEIQKRGKEIISILCMDFNDRGEDSDPERPMREILFLFADALKVEIDRITETTPTEHGLSPLIHTSGYPLLREEGRVLVEELGELLAKTEHAKGRQFDEDELWNKAEEFVDVVASRHRAEFQQERDGR